MKIYVVYKIYPYISFIEGSSSHTHCRVCVCVCVSVVCVCVCVGGGGGGGGGGGNAKIRQLLQSPFICQDGLGEQKP